MEPRPRLRFASLLISTLALVTGCPKSMPTPSDAGPDTAVPMPILDRTVEQGPIRGIHIPDEGVVVYGGIPYAAPPLGSLRFAPPAPPASWTEPRPSSLAHAQCPQLLPFGTSGFSAGAEDCLVLNVVVPDTATVDTPVVVWLHGGGFTIGSGEQADRATNARLFARTQGVIVVTLNYRIGQLGFLAHPALTAEQGGHSGNYGMLDQLAALRWVKRNVAAFGGDPDAITLYGQSAGGMSACAWVGSPLVTDDAAVPPAERPLFHRLALQSAPCDVPLPTLATAEAQGRAYAAALGCDDLAAPWTDADVRACLRDPARVTTLEARDTMRTATDFIRPDASRGEASWGPILDGHVLDAQLLDAIGRAARTGLPVYGGYADDEGNTSMHFRLIRQNARPAVARIVDQAGFEAAVNGLFRGGITPTERDALYAGASARARYQPATYTAVPTNPAVTGLVPAELTPYEQALAAIHGDMDLLCPARRTLRTLGAQGAVVSAYLFAHDDPPFQVAPAFPLGAFHSGDVQLFFGVPAGGALFGRTFDEVEAVLARQMQGSLAAFARGEDLAVEGLPSWPARTGAGAPTMRFDANPAVLDDPHGDDCDAVFDGFGRDRIGVP